MPVLAYILSASHSGSTLLAMLLGAHPQACTVGELKGNPLADPDNYLCSCRQKIKECAFWTDVHQAMKRNGVNDFDIAQPGTSFYHPPSSVARRLLGPLYRNSLLEGVRDMGLALCPGWHAYLKKTQTRNTVLVQSLLEVTGAKLVIDSSKLALRLKYLLRIPGLEVKVIRLVRDGRAVALTYMDEWGFADASNPALRGGGAGIQRPPPRKNMADAAREWRRSNESSDCVLGGLLDSQWVQIRYEDLCARPDQILKNLCQFLGLDANSMNLEFRSKVQHVVGNGMRLDSTSKIQVDERWRTVLSQTDLNIFERMAGNLNRTYGYT